jgi:hypothetical protein
MEAHLYSGLAESVLASELVCLLRSPAVDADGSPAATAAAATDGARVLPILLASRLE